MAAYDDAADMVAPEAACAKEPPPTELFVLVKMAELFKFWPSEAPFDGCMSMTAPRFIASSPLSALEARSKLLLLTWCSWVDTPRCLLSFGATAVYVVFTFLLVLTV